MEQNRTPIWPIIGLMVLGALSWRGYVYFQPKQSRIQRAPFDYEKYAKGEVEPIASPNLLQGDPQSLRFEKVDLGVGYLQAISEGGDVLYTFFGNQAIEFPIKDSDGFMRTGIKTGKGQLRFRKSDGSVQDLSSFANAYLSRSGKLFELGPPGSLLVKYNGKTLHESNGFSSGFSGVTITNDGIFPPGSHESQFLFGKNFEIHEQKMEVSRRPRFTRLDTESSEIGTIGSVFGAEFKFDQIAIAHDGSINFVDLPESLPMTKMMGSKSAFYLHAGQSIPSPLYEFRNGKFSQTPLPPAIYSFNLFGASSQGNFLMEVSRFDPTLKGKSANSYHSQKVYVHDGKYFDLKSILHSVGLDDAQSRYPDFATQPNMMDENGDFIVVANEDDYQHIYLLKRLN